MNVKGSNILRSLVTNLDKHIAIVVGFSGVYFGVGFWIKRPFKSFIKNVVQRLKVCLVFIGI